MYYYIMKQTFHISYQNQQKLKIRIIKLYLLLLFSYIIIFLYKNIIIINKTDITLSIVMSAFIAFLVLIYCLYKIESYSKIKLIISSDRLIYESYRKDKSYELLFERIANIVPIIKNNQIKELHIKTNFSTSKLKHIEKLDVVYTILKDLELPSNYDCRVTNIDNFNRKINYVTFLGLISLIIKYYSLFNVTDFDYFILITKSSIYYLSNLYLLHISIITFIKYKILRSSQSKKILVMAIILFIFLIIQSILYMPNIIDFLFSNKN